ncbi:MAG: 5-formyltetrahydrofolate cyclo-ligase [Halobacteriovorax sp.]|nr:5-formyltetrahydrofolate cyclo-ligase [Halobacteriovorax sp.]
MPASERVRQSKALSQNLFEYLSQISTSLESMVIGVFSPLPDEPDWTLSSQLSSLQTAFPFDEGSGLMSFRRCKVSELQEATQFGVKLKVPPKDAPRTQPNMMIVPGLGFTTKGHRLGRGGGYYDRWLADFNETIIGLCFEEQLLQTLSTEAHDKMMSAVITPKRVWLP